MRVHGPEANEFSGTGRSIRQRGAWILAALICALAASHAQTTAPGTEKLKQSNQALAAGRRTFESTCAPCHGLNGREASVPRILRRAPEVVRLSDRETLKILQEGILQKGMPPFAALGPAKLSEVLNYLRSLQGKGKTPAVTASIEEGKEHFCQQRRLFSSAIWSKV